MHSFKENLGQKFHKDELDKYLIQELNKSIRSSNIQSKVILDSRLVSTDIKQLTDTVKGFTANTFKQNQEITMDDLKALKFKLFMCLCFYEFFRIKEDDSIPHGEISMKSMAKVFISYINIYRNKQYLEKLKNNQYKLEGTVNFKEFVSFFWYCQNCHTVKSKLRKGNSLSIENVIEDANNVNKKSMPDPSKLANLDKRTIGLIFEILDTDKNGVLTVDEVEEVLKKRDFFNTQGEYKDLKKDFYEFFKKLAEFIKSNFPSLR